MLFGWRAQLANGEGFCFIAITGYYASGELKEQVREKYGGYFSAKGGTGESKV